MCSPISAITDTIPAALFLVRLWSRCLTRSVEMLLDLAAMIANLDLLQGYLEGARPFEGRMVKAGFGPPGSVGASLTLKVDSFVSSGMGAANVRGVPGDRSGPRCRGPRILVSQKDRKRAIAIVARYKACAAGTAGRSLACDARETRRPKEFADSPRERAALGGPARAGEREGHEEEKHEGRKNTNDTTSRRDDKAAGRRAKSPLEGSVGR